jgi:DNA invertase Pin-like site-specific DNA recombinase
MTNGKPRLAFSYLRFSCNEQGKGSSTKRQTDLRESYCQRHNLILDDSRRYEDRGVSGFHGKNAVAGHFAEFLDLVKTGQVPAGSVLLIESIDRFSRDQIRSARDRLEQILEAGIEIHTLQPERIYDTSSLTDPFALIGMILEFSRAHEYSQQLSNRCCAAWSHKREKAKAHQAPLSKRPWGWLRVVDGKYEVIPERAKTVELIYQLCADGMGINLITKELVKRKIPPLSGKKWGESYVTKLLLGEAPIGHHQPQRRDPATKKKIPSETIHNLFPPVISETLNAQAKIAMRQRKNRGGRVDFDNGPIHPFLGLVQSHSGTPLRIKYRQINRLSGDPGMATYLRDETGNTYPLEQFEQIMLEWLIKFEPAPVQKQSSEITTLEEKITKLDYKIQTLKDKINAGEEFESFLELLANAERERQATSEQLDQLRAVQPLEKGFTIFWAKLYSLWNIDGMVLGPEFGSLPLLDIEKAKKEKRDALLEVRGTLRRMIRVIQVTIGRESWSCNKKSLRITVQFNDGTRGEFTHVPGDIPPAKNSRIRAL